MQIVYMSYKIIVARYNENIDWFDSEMENCIIYNKGNKLNIEGEILLENVGRESETYLHYIISNYDDLPDVVVFTQANIADHRGTNDINYLLKLKNEALVHDISLPYISHCETDIHAVIHKYFNKEWNLKISATDQSELIGVAVEEFRQEFEVAQEVKEGYLIEYDLLWRTRTKFEREIKERRKIFEDLKITVIT